MLRKLIILLAFVLVGNIKAQEINPERYSADFEAAYVAFPNIPDGILEGVAFAQTRIRHISGNNASCAGIPQVKGVMGLTEDGKGYFRNNLEYVSSLSGISIHDIKTKPADNIMAYASAYSQLVIRTGATPDDFIAHDQILKTLSEIPWGENAASDFALSCFTYEVFSFLNNPHYQLLFELPERTINLEVIYGSVNYTMLTGEKIMVSTEAVLDEEMREFRGMDRTGEYGPALWDGAPACNYSSRGGAPITAVTVHTIQGSYAGAISWAKNCISNVSYHYVVRSSDGQITQMVLEEDKAWHVGSENPYTIGIEHEGYVDDPVWYTEAMYVASADLVRDITESGYGINPLRTYQGPATAGTLTLGACTKIKGHQHFPSALHTDPGINWDWEHYYQLINNEPDITVYTGTTGSHFDSGGAAGNYDNDERFLYLIQPFGAANVTLNVVNFNLEENWDYMYIYDGDDLDAPLFDDYTGTIIPDVITSSGGSILMEFRSDCGITDAGWEIDWTSIIGDGVGDELAPTTEVVLEETWYTEDFTTSFTDLDDTGGSGVNFQFYQVIDFNGAEWRSNDEKGFFSDNFDDVVHADWTSLIGTWGISEETLQQNDEASGNTNIYASVNQDDYDSYFYHWSGKIGGAGDDKRAGLHFMCDDPTLTNRGNSYFVWFREDDDKVQIYKVVDDVFALETNIEYTFSPDTWYDFKTVYDKLTGGIHVWVNNVHVASWEDDAPLLTGNSVSFRSGNSVYNVNNFKIYHNRESESLVTVGADGDARFQNSDPYTSAAKVKSIIVDSAYNISVIGSQLVDIDWTPPLPIGWLNDGEGADIVTTTSNTELSANWATTTDPNSGIARYWYAIGTTPGDSNIVSWTDNWYADTVTHTGLSLTLGETYYFSVIAENGAGLLSDTIYSDGQLLIEPTEAPVAGFIPDHTNLCGLDSILLENGSTDALTYEWFIPEGTPSYSTEINPYVYFDISGIFAVTLVATGPGGVDTLVQTLTVDLDDPPVASFTPSTDIVLLSDPLVTFENNSLDADGYYWSFGDGTFSTDENPWHSYTEIGEFEVSLIAINGDCPNDTTSITIIVTDSDGIFENGLTAISIFPNPASDHIRITTSKSINSKFSYRIYDASGRLITQETNIDLIGDHQISVESLAKGVYHIKIQIGESSVLKKFIIE